MRKVNCALSVILLTITVSWAQSDGVPRSEKIYQSYSNMTVPYNISASSDTTLGDVVYEIDIETPTGDCQLLGVEFDGTYFYVTGGASGTHPNKVYVIDTSGNLVMSLDQPTSIHNYWGWRDLTWDGAYAGPDRIDTLYGSAGSAVDKFGINLADSTIDYYGSFLGPLYPNRALAYKAYNSWFFTGNALDSCHKFAKHQGFIMEVYSYYYMYGAAYDTDVSADHVWWHSQDYTASPFYCLIEQMEAYDMSFTWVEFPYVPTIIDSGIAGGLCFHEGFRGMDVLFALVQGAPVDVIVGIFVRFDSPGIAEAQEAAVQRPGLEIYPNPFRHSTDIRYRISDCRQKCELEIYDITGRLVTTLSEQISVSSHQISVRWDGKDCQGRKVPSGVYFIRFETWGYKETEKIVISR
jgi:hypothetical protein